MNGWDILIGGAIALLLVLAFRTATAKKGRCCGDCCHCGSKKKKDGSPPVGPAPLVIPVPF